MHTRPLKLSEYAKANGIHYQTAFRWYQAGRIPGAYTTPTGAIYVHSETKENRPCRTVVYARVSNQSRRTEMQFQVNRCQDFCAARGLVVDSVYSEVASGMNDARRKLWEMLDSMPTTIVVENKDRLTRFGYRYLEKLLARQGCSILVMNPNDNDEQDLMKDMVAIITSFCCRLYGLRRIKNKLDKIKAVVAEVKEA